ncbi:MAG: serine/threonine-protein kinase [bacterium]
MLPHLALVKVDGMASGERLSGALAHHGPPPLACCPLCGGIGAIASPCRVPACRRLGLHCLPACHLPERAFDPRSEVGRLLGGKYLLVDRIGGGGGGRVFLALQQPIGLRTAVKLLHGAPDPLSSPERLRLEARALAGVNHPNVVRLLDFGEAEETVWLVMELVEGGYTLADALLEGLDPIEGHRILTEVCHGLDAAHAQGVVHRDVKPSNILLQPLPGRPPLTRLADFGLARFLGDDRTTALAAGTPRYMAPEQGRRRGIGPWTDWYAVGIIACEALLGRYPFGEGTPFDVMRRKCSPTFDPVAALGVELGEATAAFLRGILSPRVGLRPESLADVRRGLDAMLAERAVARSAGDATGGTLVDASPVALASVDLSLVEGSIEGVDRAGGGDARPSPPGGGGSSGAAPPGAAQAPMGRARRPWGALVMGLLLVAVGVASQVSAVDGPAGRAVLDAGLGVSARVDAGGPGGASAGEGPLAAGRVTATRGAGGGWADEPWTVEPRPPAPEPVRDGPDGSRPDGPEPDGSEPAEPRPAESGPDEAGAAAPRAGEPTAAASRRAAARPAPLDHHAAARLPSPPGRTATHPAADTGIARRRPRPGAGRGRRARADGRGGVRPRSGRAGVLRRNGGGCGGSPGRGSLRLGVAPPRRPLARAPRRSRAQVRRDRQVAAAYQERKLRPRRSRLSRRLRRAARPRREAPPSSAHRRDDRSLSLAASGDRPRRSMPSTGRWGGRRRDGGAPRARRALSRRAAAIAGLRRRGSSAGSAVERVRLVERGETRACPASWPALPVGERDLEGLPRGRASARRATGRGRGARWRAAAVGGGGDQPGPGAGGGGEAAGAWRLGFLRLGARHHRRPQRRRGRDVERARLARHLAVEAPISRGSAGRSRAARGRGDAGYSVAGVTRRAVDAAVS